LLRTRWPRGRLGLRRGAIGTSRHKFSGAWYGGGSGGYTHQCISTFAMSRTLSAPRRSTTALTAAMSCSVMSPLAAGWTFFGRPPFRPLCAAFLAAAGAAGLLFMTQPQAGWLLDRAWMTWPHLGHGLDGNAGRFVSTNGDPFRTMGRCQ